MKLNLHPGKSHPLGSKVVNDGVNFALFSEHAYKVELLLFSHPSDASPTEVFELDPELHRTYSFWHAYVEGAKAGMGYAYRVYGSDDYGAGHRYNPEKILIDPYGRAIHDSLWDRTRAIGPGDNMSHSLRSVVVDDDGFDWDGDVPLSIPKQNTIVYEMHVGGFTKHPNSQTEHPGTFLGLIEKIPYLKNLGVTAVELLPINAFDRKEIVKILDDGRELKDYWGYSTLSYFSLHQDYCVSDDPHEQIVEFKTMVRELHKAGIEVIMDVVFNHTDEGNQYGPTYCFRGLDNSVYYHLNPHNKSEYVDFSGCGNSLNCNHPIVSKMIRESLEYWASEMHVDGFRLDEGSVLSRNQHGNPEVYPRVLWEIELSEILAETKLFTEAWDATGLYEVGRFPGYRWSEWNGRYRDAIRKYVRGDYGMVGEVASRMAGSADMYEYSREKPINSLNYITCHDGFTLHDLVSYNWKHNNDNGEHNQDGIDENYSWNCGEEGETTNAEIQKLRLRQMKNFFTILLLSQGVPMITAGDEVAQTYFGNNNVYAQDNELAWFDWDRAGQYYGLHEHVKKLIEIRKNHGMLRRKSYFAGIENKRGLYDIEWHGCSFQNPGWNNPTSKVLAMTLGAMKEEESDVFVAMNMEEKNLSFDLPPIKDRNWKMILRTDGADIQDEIMRDATIEVPSRTILVFESVE